MTLPLIDSLTAPPVVGERYPVPCLRSRCGRHLFPILGPLHADPEIEVPDVHGHLDLRFVTDETARVAAMQAKDNEFQDLLFLHAAPLEIFLPMLFLMVVHDDRGTGISLEPLVCLREMPRYDRCLAERWLERLEARLEGAVVTNGRCPHKDVYSRVFHQATLAVEGEHLYRALPLLPAWWGVVTMKPDHPHAALGSINLVEVVRPGAANPSIDPRVLAELLWREEALALLEARGAARGVRSKPKPAVWDRLSETLTLAELSRAVCARLRARKAERAARITLSAEAS